MTAPRIRADFEQLQQVAGLFQQHLTATQHTLALLQRTKNVLEGGDWEGQGASAFYREMDEAVLPALQRLVQALQTGAASTTQISQTMQHAEDAAAAVFRTNGAAATAGTSAAGASREAASSSAAGFRAASGPARSAVPQAARRAVASGGRAIGQVSIRDGASADDVNQGQYGTCFVLAPAAALAQSHPDLLAQRIHDNGDGSFNVTLYHKPASTMEMMNEVASGNQPGWQTTRVSLNDLASVPEFRRARSKDRNELWPALIEEAYIQQASQRGEMGAMGAFGTIGQHYAAQAHGGDPSVALMALTGVESRDFNPAETSLAELKRQVEAHNPVVVSTPEKFTTGAQGIVLGTGAAAYGDVPVTNHAYTVTGVDAAHNTITLRNPWGTGNAQASPYMTLPFPVFQTMFAYGAVSPVNP